METQDSALHSALWRNLKRIRPKAWGHGDIYHGPALKRQGQHSEVISLASKVANPWRVLCSWFHERNQILITTFQGNISWGVWCTREAFQKQAEDQKQQPRNYPQSSLLISADTHKPPKNTTIQVFLVQIYINQRAQHEYCREVW